MEIRINKEIREYSQSIFFGLSPRQCLFSLLAVGAAVGLYFGLRDVLPQDMLGWICVLSAAPFGALGFLRYQGMAAERLAIAFLRAELLMPERLYDESENIYARILLPALEQIRLQHCKKHREKSSKKKEETPLDEIA